ncbi:MAG: IPT/TIG domain-containing protein [Chloroflexota bacterium]
MTIRKAVIGLILFSLISMSLPVLPVAGAATAIGISPSQARVGESVRFTGSVDYAGDRYELYWESIIPANLLARGVTVTTAASIEFTVPEAPRGAHTVILKDLEDNSTASTTLTILPNLDRLEPTSGATGTKITVHGTGFSTNESGIRVLYDGTELAVSTNANNKGSWSLSFDCPPSDRGNHAITARGSATQPAETVPLIFTVSPRLNINPSSGTSGTSVTINGSGFVQYEAGITVTFDGNVIKNDIRADNKGSWAHTYVIPAGTTKGVHTFAAYGPSTLASEVNNATFSTAASITIQPNSGAVGGIINVSGKGFSPNETGIEITFDGSLIKEGVIADASGNWTVTVSIPLRNKGNHSIRAGGPFTNISDVPAVNYTINPTVSLSPPAGPLGTEITVRGTGFDPSRAISILFDNKPAAVEATTTRDGSFQTKFTVAEGKAGPRTVVISDDAGSSFQLSFSIESEPPPAPQPVTPETDVRFTFFGGATVTFEWSAVQDPSGISYVFELSRAADFTSPLISKSGLLETSYSLGPKETLDFGDFYWRVRAIDHAGNQSAWSAVRSLRVGVMPVWVFVLIIVGTVVVFAGVLWYLWGKRGRYDF